MTGSYNPADGYRLFIEKFYSALGNASSAAAGAAGIVFEVV
jgi:hypothetical protein